MGPGAHVPALVEGFPTVDRGTQLRTIAYLQRQRGNAYVQRLLQERAGGLTDRFAGANAERGPQLHRQPAATPATSNVGTTWQMPFELGPVQDRGTARSGITAIQAQIGKSRQDLEGAEIAQLDSDLKALGTLASQIPGDAALTGQDVTLLSGISALVEQNDKSRLANVQNRLAQTLEGLSSLDIAEDRINEAIHNAFAEGEKDELAELKETVEKVHSFNEGAHKVIDWSKSAAGALKLVKTFEELEKLAEWSKQGGELVEHIGQIMDAADALATLAGKHNVAGGEMQASIRQLRAGYQLLDVGLGLVKNVPLLGTLWSKWYYPLAKACLDGLMKITRLVDKSERDSIVYAPRGPTGAPIIPEKAASYFPGGQPVLNCMFALVNGGMLVLTPEVEEYFIKNAELFNIGQAKDDEIEVKSDSHWYNPFSWGSRERAPNLKEWLPGNADKVWTQLYGNLPHNLVERPM
jgi:hypothetical protein